MPAHPDARPTPGRDVPAGIRDTGNYSPVLESLRGIAILLVFTFHAVFMFHDDEAVGRSLEDVDPWLAFVTAGHTGVTLFFVLSAFLLSRPFLAETRGGPPVRWGRFWTRRVLRIMPLYVTAVVVASLLSARTPADVGRGLPYLAFLNAVPGFAVPLRPYSDVWWSLATEAQFYLVLPLLAALLRSRAGRAVGVILALGWLAGYATWVRGGLTPALDARLCLGLSLLGRAPAFALGATVAWLHGRWGPSLRAGLARHRWVRLGGADLALVAVLLALGQLLAAVSSRGFFQAEASWHAWHVAESALWAAVLLLLLVAPLRIAPLLSSRALGLLGILSYSLYIVHRPILALYKELAPIPWIVEDGRIDLTPWAIAGIAFAFVIALGVSVLTYRLIERPFLVRKQRLGG